MRVVEEWEVDWKAENEGLLSLRVGACNRDDNLDIAFQDDAIFRAWFWFDSGFPISFLEILC